MIFIKCIQEEKILEITIIILFFYITKIIIEILGLYNLLYLHTVLKIVTL
jgi:hypothetical protein